MRGAIALLALLIATPALACSCAPLQEGAPLPDAIVEAQVAGLYPASDGSATVTAVLMVKRAFHGSVVGRTQVRTPSNSAACGVAFRVGETTRLAMNRAGRGFVTNLCINRRAAEALRSAGQ